MTHEKKFQQHNHAVMKKCSLCGYEAEEMACMNCEEPMEEKCDACGETPGNCDCPRTHKKSSY